MVNQPELDQPQPRSEGHFKLLFLAFLMLFLVAPIAWLIELRLHTKLADAVVLIVFAMDIVFAAMTAAVRHRDRVIAWCLAIPTVVGFGISLIVNSGPLWMVTHVIAMAFLGHTIVVVSRYVLSAKRVSANIVAASLCVYLFMCVACAMFYSVLYYFDNTSFAFNSRSADGTPIATEFLFTALYYSLVTMTTLGYGDIVPTTPPTQMTAAVQAVFGQMYIAVLVARLVGMQVATSLSDETS